MNKFPFPLRGGSVRTGPLRWCPVISSAGAARLLRCMTRSQAFKLMRTRDGRGRPKPFAITYCTLDESRGTGGDIRTLHNLVLSGAHMNLERNLSFGIRRANGKDFKRGVPIMTVKVPLLLRVNAEPVV